MKVLRQVNNVQLNEGSLMAKGLFNLSKDNKVSLWFSSEDKDDFMAMSDEEFYAEASAVIDYAENLV
jgi:hypothetical protein